MLILPCFDTLIIVILSKISINLTEIKIMNNNWHEDFGDCPGADEFIPEGWEKSKTPENVREICLYAWIGEDELGSGEIGLKQGQVPAGMIPLVAIDEFKIDRDYLQKALQEQANNYGKTIRLCKFVFVEEIITLKPEN